ncbi:hypothetical protein C8R43DRAFT_1022874 [Mycena crocata]|nr:hypothetical protein C8R43DRAFT_1022874 [Mycena crocata]
MSPLAPSVDSDSFYRGTNNTASTSSSSGHIHQPQALRPIPGALAWGTEQHPLVRGPSYPHDSYASTYFPGPENSLGLFSMDPNYSTAEGSTSRPSRHLQPTPPTRLEIKNFEIEGGWSFDAAGRTLYVPHGGIKEVDEHNVDLPASMAVDLPHDSRTFIDEPLPPETTPPPRPVHRPIELIPLPLLDRLPLGDGSNTYTGPLPIASPPKFDDFYGSFNFHDRPTTPTTCSSPNIMTQSQELNVIEQNLVSIVTATRDIKSLRAIFATLSGPVDAGVVLCKQVSKALHEVEASLKRRSVIPPEEWRLRSISCQRKYDYRLRSLRTTLQRLHTLSSTPPRVTQFKKIRDLLDQHRAKLSDLAAKFNATFDRLRYRHFTNLCTDVYNDVQRRIYARKEDRKAARAARTGPYGFAFHLQGRRPSIVEAS